MQTFADFQLQFRLQLPLGPAHCPLLLLPCLWELLSFVPHSTLSLSLSFIRSHSSFSSVTTFARIRFFCIFSFLFFLPLFLCFFGLIFVPFHIWWACVCVCASVRVPIRVCVCVCLRLCVCEGQSRLFGGFSAGKWANIAVATPPSPPSGNRKLYLTVTASLVLSELCATATLFGLLCVPLLLLLCCLLLCTRRVWIIPHANAVKMSRYDMRIPTAGGVQLSVSLCLALCSSVAAQLELRQCCQLR